MAENNFSTQYKNPNWQKKRLEILKRDEFNCVNCGEDNNTLHVHHYYYNKNTKIWDYENDNLVTLCELCHDSWHLIEKEIKELLTVPTNQLMDIYMLLIQVRKMNILQVIELTKIAKVLNNE
jgi:hypothetical protein